MASAGGRSGAICTKPQHDKSIAACRASENLATLLTFAGRTASSYFLRSPPSLYNHLIPSLLCRFDINNRRPRSEVLFGYIVGTTTGPVNFRSPGSLKRSARHVPDRLTHHRDCSTRLHRSLRPLEGMHGILVKNDGASIDRRDCTSRSPHLSLNRRICA
jgi:hypothetical protein